MEFRILGPLETWRDGRELELGTGRQRALLALLLLHADEPVSSDQLIDALWGESPPASAAKVVQNYVSQLRRALPAETILTRDSGYLIRAGATDADEFERLLAEARRQPPQEAAVTLRTALRLWRGPPLADVAYDDWAQAEIARLEELRLAALEERIDADLTIGAAASIVPELEALVIEHPLRERLRAQLMLALYRSGRQAEALASFTEARQRLVDELAIEPGPELQDLQRKILAHDPELGSPRAGRPLLALAGRPRRLLLAAVLLIGGAAIAGIVGLLSGGNSHAALPAADSVAVLDGHGGVRGQVSVAQAPTAVASGEGAVWAANSASGTVSRIDPVARTVQQTIPVGDSPSGIAVGGGGVWVANHDDGTVSWISPESNAVVRTIRVGAGPTAVACGLGSVWVTNADDRTVSRIDAGTGEVTATIQASAVGRGIVVGGGFVWVSDEATRSLIEIDPATNTVVSTATVGTGPTAVTYGNGSVWVANALDGTVSRIDARTLAVQATIPVGEGPAGIAFGYGSIWVSVEFGQQVVRIDPRRNAVAGSTAVGNRPEGLTFADDSAWVAVQASGKGHRGGRLVVLGGGLDSIDPALASETVDTAPLGTAYDGLTSLRHAGGSAGTQLVPDLAAALPLPTAGGRSYTFHLRPGIRYSDGRLLRAVDFRRALARELELNSLLAPDFAHLAGAGACIGHRRCDLSRSVIVEGRATLTFRLPEPDARLFYKLASLVPVPAGTPQHDVGTKPLPATGPYAIQSYVPGRLLTLVRNRYFHVWSAAARPAGYPDEIVYRVITDQNAAVRDVLAGRADLLAEEVPAARVQELAARYPRQLHLDPQRATTFVFLNVRRPPFNDVRVRRALNYAVDRKRVAALHGAALLAQPTCQLVPPTVPGYKPYCPYTIAPDASGEWKAPDLTTARALIAASGTRGETIVVWSFSYFHRESQYFVALLRQLGYRARLHYIPDIAAAGAARAKTPSAQAGFDGWFGGPLAVDMFDTVGCHFHPNPAHFCDRHVDAQVARLANEEPADPAGTAGLAAAIDREITNQAPWVPLFTPRFADLTSARVGNYQYNNGYNVLLDQLWIK